MKKDEEMFGSVECGHCGKMIFAEFILKHIEQEHGGMVPLQQRFPEQKQEEEASR